MPPEEFTLDDFNRVMMTNLSSCFSRHQVRDAEHEAAGSGSIIHNGSTAGITTDGSGPVYAASKAGVIHMTRIRATQLAEFGIRVSCISPGAIVTPIFWGGHHTQSDEETNGAPHHSLGDHQQRA